MQVLLTPLWRRKPPTPSQVIRIWRACALSWICMEACLWGVGSTKGYAVLWGRGWWRWWWWSGPYHRKGGNSPLPPSHLGEGVFFLLGGGYWPHVMLQGGEGCKNGEDPFRRILSGCGWRRIKVLLLKFLRALILFCKDGPSVSPHASRYTEGRAWHLVQVWLLYDSNPVPLLAHRVHTENASCRVERLYNWPLFYTIIPLASKSYRLQRVSLPGQDMEMSVTLEGGCIIAFISVSFSPPHLLQSCVI